MTPKVTQKSLSESLLSHFLLPEGQKSLLSHFWSHFSYLGVRGVLGGTAGHNIKETALTRKAINKPGSEVFWSASGPKVEGDWSPEGSTRTGLPKPGLNPTTNIPPEYCNTNGRRTAIRMGGVLQYKWEEKLVPFPTKTSVRTAASECCCPFF